MWYLLYWLALCMTRPEPSVAQHSSEFVPGVDRDRRGEILAPSLRLIASFLPVLAPHPNWQLELPQRKMVAYRPALSEGKQTQAMLFQPQSFSLTVESQHHACNVFENPQKGMEKDVTPPIFSGTCFSRYCPSHSKGPLIICGTSLPTLSLSCLVTVKRPVTMCKCQ